MSGQGLNYRLDYHNVFTSEQNFIFDEEKGIQKLFEKFGLNQLQPTCYHDIDIRYFSFKRYTEKEAQRYYYRSEKNGLESIEIKDKNLVVEPPLYAHFQKRTIKCPEFEATDPFYVIHNQLVVGEKISIQKIEEVTKNKFYWEYVKSTFLKKFKKEKRTLGFIRYKFRMKRG